MLPSPSAPGPGRFSCAWLSCIDGFIKIFVFRCFYEGYFRELKPGSPIIYKNVGKINENWRTWLWLGAVELVLPSPSAPGRADFRMLGLAA